MWFTQTYLAEPGTGFPAYAYFLFNRYDDWEGEAIRAIRDGLRTLGRDTTEKLSILMPDEKLDKNQIGKDLEFRFWPLMDELRKGAMSIKCGLFISSIPFSQMEPNGSNARWIYYGFDEFIETGGMKPSFGGLLEKLAKAANSDDGDPISRFVYVFEGARTSINRAKLVETLSLSFSGPSVSIGKLIGLFRNDNSVITNVYR
jgi:hypothetical protein